MICHVEHEYRISKYNKDAAHYCADDEWTSISDIGKVFHGKILSCSEYERIERKYLSFIKDICLHTGTHRIEVDDLQDPFGRCTYLQETVLTDIEQICAVAQDCLREKCWCRLNGDGLFFHFGYDYYLYVGCSLNLQVISNLANEVGLFVEIMKSPYKKE